VRQRTDRSIEEYLAALAFNPGLQVVAPGAVSMRRVFSDIFPRYMGAIPNRTACAMRRRLSSSRSSANPLLTSARPHGIDPHCTDDFQEQVNWSGK
jgi:hypothetical protein